jgi:amidase
VDLTVEEITIDQLQAQMAAGAVSSHDLAELYLDRIEAIDWHGPTLRSIIETNPDALSIAEALDRERAEGHVRGPLHGIPIVVKDNIDTADRMQTTAGSLALIGSRVACDAPVAARLRDSGAVLLGKANLSEWANFRSSRSSSGWSGRGRQTRNP